MPFREIADLYRITNNVNLRARWNIAPTQEVPVVRLARETRRRELVMVRWGLIPFWAKDVKVGYSLINAVCESVAAKPSFREAFKQRRCLVPADGFYEWQKTGGKTKQPFLIRMSDQSPFAFAGLWERWQDKETGEVIESCTIITCPPNGLCAPIHNRMPAILAPEGYAAWLGETDATAEQLVSLLKPCPPEAMEAVPVSTKVNSPKNDSPDIIERAC